GRRPHRRGSRVVRIRLIPPPRGGRDLPGEGPRQHNTIGTQRRSRTPGREVRILCPHRPPGKWPPAPPSPAGARPARLPIRDGEPTRPFCSGQLPGAVCCQIALICCLFSSPLGGRENSNPCAPV